MGLRFLEETPGSLNLGARLRVIGDYGACGFDRLAGITHLLVGDAGTGDQHEAKAENETA